MKQKIGAVVFTILAFAAAGGAWYLIIEAPNEAVSNADVTVEGTVVATDIRRGSGGGDVQADTTYSADVTYRYTYSGETYRSDNLWAGPSEGTAYGDRSEAEAILDEYPEGSSVTVHLDSDNPSQSYLDTKPTTWNDYVPVGFAMLFGIMGLLSLANQFIGDDG